MGSILGRTHNFLFSPYLVTFSPPFFILITSSPFPLPSFPVFFLLFPPFLFFHLILILILFLLSVFPSFFLSPRFLSLPLSPALLSFFPLSFIFPPFPLFSLSCFTFFFYSLFNKFFSFPLFSTYVYHLFEG